MSDHSTVSKTQMIERILRYIRELPPEYGEQLLEEWMWELDVIWREQGIPEELRSRIDVLQSGHPIVDGDASTT